MDGRLCLQPAYQYVTPPPPLYCQLFDTDNDNDNDLFVHIFTKI